MSKSDDNEPDGMVALAIGVAEQRWPHTMDAEVWADEWLKQLEKTPWMASNRESMIGWFANAIMAGHDTAMSRFLPRYPTREALEDAFVDGLISLAEFDRELRKFANNDL